MEFEFNREKSSFIKVLKGKCEKNALKCSVEDNKIMIETFDNSEGKLEDAIPAVFKGTIEAKENKTSITIKINTIKNNITEVLANTKSIVYSNWLKNNTRKHIKGEE